MIILAWCAVFFAGFLSGIFTVLYGLLRGWVKVTIEPNEITAKIGKI